MTPDEIPGLLKQLSYADPRVLPTDRGEIVGKVAMWAGILCNEADVPFDFAVRAAQQHYATSEWPVTPAAIATAWRAHRRNAVQRDAERAAPAVDPDDEMAYRRALRDRRQDVANGQQPPAAIRALTAGIGRRIPAQPPADLRARAGLRARPPELAVPCPHCHAAAGDRCTAPSGRELHTAHPSRRDTHTGATP